MPLTPLVGAFTSLVGRISESRYIARTGREPKTLNSDFIESPYVVTVSMPPPLVATGFPTCDRIVDC